MANTAQLLRRQSSRDIILKSQRSIDQHELRVSTHQVEVNKLFGEKKTKITGANGNMNSNQSELMRLGIAVCVCVCEVSHVVYFYYVM